MNRAALAVLAVAVVAVTGGSIPRALAEMPASGAWQVAAGSTGNELELELHNLDQSPMAGPLAVSILNAPAWMSAIAVVSAATNALLNPGDATTALVRFDVAPGTATSERGTVTFSIAAAGGETWSQPVSLEVAEHPDEIQSDCCSAIEISTTGVGGTEAISAGAAGADHISIESAPNPSNPATNIRFTLTARTSISVTIHDVSGRLVRTLVSGPRDSGRQEIAWDGRMERGEPAPSGIYFVRVAAGGVTHSSKLVLTR